LYLGKLALPASIEVLYQRIKAAPAIARLRNDGGRLWGEEPAAREPGLWGWGRGVTRIAKLLTETLLQPGNQSRRCRDLPLRLIEIQAAVDMGVHDHARDEHDHGGNDTEDEPDNPETLTVGNGRSSL
jgi:hypothetical protein